MWERDFVYVRVCEGVCLKWVYLYVRVFVCVGVVVINFDTVCVSLLLYWQVLVCGVSVKGMCVCVCECVCECLGVPLRLGCLFLFL